MGLFRRTPPPLPWEPGGKPTGRKPGTPPALPPALPWEKPSYYPGFSSGSLPVQGETWIPISSSNVDAIQFVDGDQYPLKIRFKNPPDAMPVYEYQANEEMYDALFSAASPGRFVNIALKGVPYRRVS